MATTKISSDQLTFRSSNTGDHLLDDYLENAELGNKTLADLLSEIFDTNGDVDATIFQFRTNPLIPLQLQARVGTFASPAEDEVGWTLVGTFPTGGGTGDLLAVNNLSDVADIPTAKTNLEIASNYEVALVGGIDYVAGAGLPIGFALPIDPVDSKNLSVQFNGLDQYDGYTFNPTTITFTLGIPSLVTRVRIRINK